MGLPTGRGQEGGFTWLETHHDPDSWLLCLHWCSCIGGEWSMEFTVYSLPEASVVFLNALEGRFARQTGRQAGLLCLGLERGGQFGESCNSTSCGTFHVLPDFLSQYPHL